MKKYNRNLLKGRLFQYIYEKSAVDEAMITLSEMARELAVSKVIAREVLFLLVAEQRVFARRRWGGWGVHVHQLGTYGPDDQPRTVLPLTERSHRLGFGGAAIFCTICDPLADRAPLKSSPQVSE